MNDVPKKSFKDRIKLNPREVKIATIVGVATGVVVYLYFTQYRQTTTWCHITLDQVNHLAEQGQGVITFGMDTRDRILVALPDKV